METEGRAQLEIKFLEWLQTWHTPLLDKIMVCITTLGNDGILWIVIAILLLCSRKYRVTGVTVGIALLLCLLLGNLGLKPLIQRMRPYNVSGFSHLLIAKPTDYSFPSGHTMSSFAAAGVLYSLNRRIGVAALTVAFFIAFSRMYLYVHFPTDILAGLLIGLLIAWFCVTYIKNKLLTKWRGYYE